MAQFGTALCQDQYSVSSREQKCEQTRVNKNNFVRELFKTFNAFENLAEWGGKQRNDPGKWDLYSSVAKGDENFVRRET